MKLKRIRRGTLIPSRGSLMSGVADAPLLCDYRRFFRGSGERGHSFRRVLTLCAVLAGSFALADALPREVTSKAGLRGSTQVPRHTVTVEIDCAGDSPLAKTPVQVSIYQNGVLVAHGENVWKNVNGYQCELAEGAWETKIEAPGMQTVIKRGMYNISGEIVYMKALPGAGTVTTTYPPPSSEGGHLPSTDQAPRHTVTVEADCAGDSPLVRVPILVSVYQGGRLISQGENVWKNVNGYQCELAEGAWEAKVEAPGMQTVVKKGMYNISGENVYMKVLPGSGTATTTYPAPSGEGAHLPSTDQAPRHTVTVEADCAGDSPLVHVPILVSVYQGGRLISQGENVWKNVNGYQCELAEGAWEAKIEAPGMQTVVKRGMYNISGETVYMKALPGFGKVTTTYPAPSGEGAHLPSTDQAPRHTVTVEADCAGDSPLAPLPILVSVYQGGHLISQGENRWKNVNGYQCELAEGAWEARIEAPGMQTATQAGLNTSSGQTLRIMISLGGGVDVTQSHGEVVSVDHSDGGEVTVTSS